MIGNIGLILAHPLYKFTDNYIILSYLMKADKFNEWRDTGITANVTSETIKPI